jgi:D-alanyl-D-alanine carboxypeptidase
MLMALLTGCAKDDFSPVNSCEGIIINNASYPHNPEFTEWIERYSVQGYPGLVLYVRDGKGNIWQDARGYALIESDTPLLTCHRHHSASVSKTYIAVLVMKLYEQGLIDLDEKLSTYLPFHLSIENFNCVTVRQLLSHRSGIFDFDTNPEIFVDYLNDPFQVDHWREILNRYVEDREADFTCGSNTKYSDTNFLLLGVLLEQVSGKPLGLVMEEELLSPFGLTETYYKASEGYPRISMTANSYFYFTEGKLQNCTDWQEHFANISMGHEGIIASPADYVKFLHFLVSGQILQPESLLTMMDFTLSSENETELGLGLEKITTPYGSIYGHSGGGFGTMTLLFYEPETETTFFVGANVGSIFESEAGELFYDQLLDDLVKILKS